MKARPLKRGEGEWILCEAVDATHIELSVPGPLTSRIVPIILKGTRKGTGCWSWNGDTEKPTLRPSLKTWTDRHTCHTRINDGMVQFLNDCTHDLAGKTLELEDIEE